MGGAMRHFLPLTLLACAAGCGPAPSGIEVRGARIVASPGGAAAYLSLVNHGPADRLVAIDAPQIGASSLHLTTLSDGVMRMRAAPVGVPLGAGATVTLAPRGLHAMIMPARPLDPGTRAHLVLRFERHAPIPVEAAILSPGQEQARR
jgi:copper(I)-binding protein